MFPGTHDKYPPSPIKPTATGKPHPSYTVQPEESQLPDTGSNTHTEYMLAAAVIMFAIGGAILTRRGRG